MPIPDYAVPRPAYMQIADDLRSQIEAGKYGPGARLPSNRAMSEQYGVAAETLRQALDVLRGEDLIATQSTRGTFVLRKPREHTSGDGHSAGSAAVIARLDKLTSEVAALREELGRLQAQVMNLYHSTGQPYPYEGGITEPGRQVGLNGGGQATV
jgi:DNA-binding GntR family transcriptional regulator